MRVKTFLATAWIVWVLVSCSLSREEDTGSAGSPVHVWITTPDKQKLLSHEPDIPFQDAAGGGTVIEVDTTQRFQTIDGFGYSLTGGSAYLINQKLTEAGRDDLLRELFLTDGDGIGVSYLRISIGASDLDDHVFSYDDTPDGNPDPSLGHFSLDEDRKNLIPVLKSILNLNPDIKIMGSPWSAPAWMKTNNHVKGGSLKPEYYASYTNYFVKYIQEMKSEGISIDAITLQNEPENPHNTPSMLMSAQEQADFIKDHLGPAFETAGLDTKIVVFDHNCDHPEYPVAILDDPDARKYVDGSAFHLYLGEVEAMSSVHNAHPDKNLYFTEQWTSGEGNFGDDLKWHVRNLIVGATRNWSRNVLEWNLAADPQFEPHTNDGGCTLCMGALTIGNSITRNVSFYIIAHASKFVRPGATRVASGIRDGLHNVAFVNPSGSKVLIVVNDNDHIQKFSIRFRDQYCNGTLPAGAVATFVWE